jgi:hypothetical protein
VKALMTALIVLVTAAGALAGLEGTSVSLVEPQGAIVPGETYV